MKQGWEMLTLGNACEKVCVGYVGPTAKYYCDNGPLFLRTKNVTTNGFSLKDVKYITNAFHNTLKKSTLLGGEVLMSRVITDVVNCAIVPDNIGLANCANVVIVKPGKNMSSKFLYYFIKSPTSQSYLLSRKVGSAQLVVNTKVVQSWPIKVPPLPEQKRIVSILDKAFTAIAKAKSNAEQNLKNAKELFESYLQGVFENKGEGWEEKTLNDVCEITSKLIDPTKAEFQNLIHIGAGNIESQKETLVDLKTAKEEKLISGKFLFDKRMVLYSKIRPYLMKVVKCNFQGLCSADIYPLTPIKNEINQGFLYYLLLSKRFTEYAIEGSQRAGMPKVNRKHLFNYVFDCPSLKEQQTIVKKLNALSAETKKLEYVYHQKIEDLEELKKSILQKAFNGELKTEKEIAA